MHNNNNNAKIKNTQTTTKNDNVPIATHLALSIGSTTFGTENSTDDENVNNIDINIKNRSV